MTARSRTPRPNRGRGSRAGTSPSGESSSAVDDAAVRAWGALLLRDLTLGDSRKIRAADLDDLCDALLRYVGGAQVVYTAFDGDHFHLCRHMRTEVLRTGGVPANPESILGYKHCVDAHGQKRGVMLDDLTVLQGCDELWLFTRGGESIKQLFPRLAEGVIVETLFFRKRRVRSPVWLIDVVEMLKSGRARRTQLKQRYGALASMLDAEQRPPILRLANSDTRIDSQLRALHYFLMDPLDFKYAEWLRVSAYAQHRVPLVPGLAIELGDFEWLADPMYRMGMAVAAWAALMKPSRTSARLQPIEPGRPPSLVVQLLEQCWLRLKPGNIPSRQTWQDVRVPKAAWGSAWPLTPREARVLARREQE